MRNIRVDLGENSYEIYVQDSALAGLGQAFGQLNFISQAVVITDDNVEKIYGSMLQNSLSLTLELADVISVPAGEKSKSLPMLEKVMNRLLKKQYDRKLLVLAFGGGVVGDLAGFVASIYKRGVRYIQIPTTLLAQVDSSVGGKTGVNHSTGKNLIGSIYQPKLVWCDLHFLKTLPRREITSGMAEVVKYGVIQDPDLFATCESRLDDVYALEPNLLGEIIQKSCKIKADIVSEDERENGMRMILNFGHTVGHSFEAALGYNQILHGEAVLMGMLAESYIAWKMGVLDKAGLRQISQLIYKFELGNLLQGLSISQLIHFMKADKKAVDGKLRFVLPKAVGKVEVVEQVDLSLIQAGFEYVMEHFS